MNSASLKPQALPNAVCEFSVAYLIAVPYLILALRIVQVYAERNSTSSYLQLDRHVDLWGYGILRRIDDFGFWLLIGIGVSALHAWFVIRSTSGNGSSSQNTESDHKRILPRQVCIWIVASAMASVIVCVKHHDTSITYGLLHWSKNSAHVPGAIEQTLPLIVRDQERLPQMLCPENNTIAETPRIHSFDVHEVIDDFVSIREILRDLNRQGTLKATNAEVAYLFAPAPLLDDPGIRMRREMLQDELQFCDTRTYPKTALMSIREHVRWRNPANIAVDFSQRMHKRR